MAARLEKYFPTLYRSHGLAAHDEWTLDSPRLSRSPPLRMYSSASWIMGFTPPPSLWPVAGTLMVEPTESESKYELDRFCDAMTLHPRREDCHRIRRGRPPKNNLPQELSSLPPTRSPATGTVPTRANRRPSRQRVCSNTNSGPTSVAWTTSSATATPCVRASAWKTLPRKLGHQTPRRFLIPQRGNGN